MKLLVHVNDSPHEVTQGTTLAELLEDLAIAQPGGAAAAVNDAVVPRGKWAAQELHAEDRVLVISAMQGG